MKQTNPGLVDLLKRDTILRTKYTIDIFIYKHAGFLWHSRMGPIPSEISKKSMLSVMSFCLDKRPWTWWVWWNRQVVKVEQLIEGFWHLLAICACMEVMRNVQYVVRGICASTTFLHINSFCFMAFGCTNLKVPRVYFVSSDWACLGHSFAALRGKYNPVKLLDLSRSLDRFSMVFSNWFLEIPTNLRA